MPVDPVVPLVVPDALSDVELARDRELEPVVLLDRELPPEPASFVLPGAELRVDPASFLLAEPEPLPELLPAALRSVLASLAADPFELEQLAMSPAAAMPVSAAASATFCMGSPLVR